MRDPVSYIGRTRKLYDTLGYQPYNWFHADSEAPFTQPAKKLKDSRLGLVSTAGTYVAGQVAYHYKDDTGIRKIASHTPADQIRFSHITENYLLEARQDPLCMLPLNALNQMKQKGLVGDLAANYYSCMGGIYSQRRVREELIPSLETAITNEEIDLLLLIPL